MLHIIARPVREADKCGRFNAGDVREQGTVGDVVCPVSLAHARESLEESALEQQHDDAEDNRHTADEIGVLAVVVKMGGYRKLASEVLEIIGREQNIHSARRRATRVRQVLKESQAGVREKAVDLPTAIIRL